MPESRAPWSASQYEASGGPGLLLIRELLQKYHDAAWDGTVTNFQPDPEGCLDINKANRVIDALVAQQHFELAQSYRSHYWPYAERPADSLTTLPDGAKLALLQELIAILQRYDVLKEAS